MTLILLLIIFLISVSVFVGLWALILLFIVCFARPETNKEQFISYWTLWTDYPEGKAIRAYSLEEQQFPRTVEFKFFTVNECIRAMPWSPTAVLPSLHDNFGISFKRLNFCSRWKMSQWRSNCALCLIRTLRLVRRDLVVGPLITKTTRGISAHSACLAFGFTRLNGWRQDLSLILGYMF